MTIKTIMIKWPLTIVVMRLAKASVPGIRPGMTPGVGAELDDVVVEVVEEEVEEAEVVEGVVLFAGVEVVVVVVVEGGTTPGGRLSPMELKSPGEV